MAQMSHRCQDGSQDTSDAEHAFVVDLTLHHTPELYILIRILFHFNASNLSSDMHRTLCPIPHKAIHRVVVVVHMVHAWH